MSERVTYYLANGANLIVEDENGVARTFGPGDPLELDPADDVTQLRVANGSLTTDAPEENS